MCRMINSYLRLRGRMKKVSGPRFAIGGRQSHYAREHCHCAIRYRPNKVYAEPPIEACPSAFSQDGPERLRHPFIRDLAVPDAKSPARPDMNDLRKCLCW